MRGEGPVRVLAASRKPPEGVRGGGGVDKTATPIKGLFLFVFSGASSREQSDKGRFLLSRRLSRDHSGYYKIIMCL